jgi:glycosidase
MKLKNIWIGFIVLFILVSCENVTKSESNRAETKKSSSEKVSPEIPFWAENASIYEVNLRQYTEEGTFNTFKDEIPRLKAMGVDILWFMPIHPIGEENRKGGLGSYYSVRDYKAVNPEFGTMDDFKALVEEAHKQGMFVLLDWVANHTSWDNVWVENNPEYYEKDKNGNFVSPFDWTDVIALDYSNEQMRAQMTDAMKFWVEEANIDGYRCDVASEVPTDFWDDLRPQLQAIKPVFMLAESEEVDLLEYGFDMNYGWEFHHLMNKIAKGEKGPSDIIEYLKKEDKRVPERAYVMYFITNHDENSWNGTINERLGDAEDVMAILTYTLGGMPLIYSGQESSNNKRLEFFEKDLIEWGDYPKSNFYSTLNKMKNDHPAVWNGSSGGEFRLLPTNQDDKVLAYTKKKGSDEIMVLVNLSDQEYEAVFDVHDLLDYKPILRKNFLPTLQVNSFTMLPWGYCVLYKNYPN